MPRRRRERQDDLPADRRHIDGGRIRRLPRRSLRLCQATYYLPDGEGLELPTHLSNVAVAAEFNVDVVRTAIREAQALVPGYTYMGFCDKVKRAGCAGYLVSFLGRRLLYFGRTAETHTEYFPGTQPAVSP